MQGKKKSGKIIRKPQPSITTYPKEEVAIKVEPSKPSIRTFGKTADKPSGYGRRVTSDDLKKALVHFGWQESDVKDWFTDGHAIGFTTLSGHSFSIEIGKIR